MKKFPAKLILAALLANPFLLAAQTNSLPPTADILRNALARAQREDDNDRAFAQHYHYTRVRLTEFRNDRGELKKREEKRSGEGAQPGATPKPAAPPKPVEKDAPVSDTHSNVRGKAIEVKDYSLAELAARFQFTPVGRDVVNGRAAFVLDFQPGGKDLPVHNFKDRFINKAAGRVWVDAGDFAIAKADVHLCSRVNVLGGIIGAVWKFTYSFDRERTPEGLWFARRVDWHLEGREVFLNRIVDYHEQKLDARKIF